MNMNEDMRKLLEQLGIDADVQYDRRIIDGGVLETLSVGWLENSPRMPQETTLPEKQVNIPKYELLPPKDQFVFDLRLLLDLAKATKNERSVMEKLIRRFQNGNKPSQTVSKRAPQK